MPLPPSLNRLWRFGKGHVYKAKRYTNWLAAADGVWMAQKPKGPVKTIMGPFTAEIIVYVSDKRRRDIDNLMKAAFDWLQRVEIIEDDCFNKGTYIRVTSRPEGSGIRIVIKALDKMP